MDNITHAGVGALCALGVVKLAKRRRQAQRLPPVRNASGSTTTPYAFSAFPPTWMILLTGALAGNFPDIDFVTYFVNPIYYDAYWHRGATHSLVLTPLWAALLAAILWVSLWRRRHFRVLWSVCLVGIFSHILVDLLTAWDIALWYPLSRQEHSLGLIFIIDLVLTSVIYLGLWAALTNRRITLMLSLGFACSWPLLAFTQQQRALEQARYIEHVPQATPKQSRPRYALTDNEQIRAWAQPFSIFNWMIVRTTSQGYDTAYLRVTSRDGIRWPFKWMQQSAQAYQPKTQAQWLSFVTHKDEHTRASWKHPRMYAVRDFMTYPALLETDARCVWFTDLLYTLPNMTPSFVYGLCEDSKKVQVERRATQAPWADH